MSLGLVWGDPGIGGIEMSAGQGTVDGDPGAASLADSDWTSFRGLAAVATGPLLPSDMLFRSGSTVSGGSSVCGIDNCIVRLRMPDLPGQRDVRPDRFILLPQAKTFHLIPDTARNSL